MRILLLLALSIFTFNTFADDGYRLWLKYNRIQNEILRKNYSQKLSNIHINYNDETSKITLLEIEKAAGGLLGIKPQIIQNSAQAKLVLKLGKIENANPEAFEIKTLNKQIIISGNSSKGILYGVFELIKNANFRIFRKPKDCLSTENPTENVESLGQQQWHH